MNKWNIQKVALAELENYFQENPLHPSSILPITPERIKSYCSNPRALPSDIVIYFITENKRVIAFRTVWADHISTNTEFIRFGWCSGNWVDSNYRRKGLSLLLLNEMYNDWNQKLMFTNYAPASEAAYEKSGLFSYHLERKGLRFYNAINLFELYEERGLNRSKKLALFIMNVIFKVASTVKNILFQKYPLKNIVGEESPIFIKQKHSIGQSFFSRSESEFNWIFNKPWLIANQNTDPSYPFSWKVNSFTYSFVSFQSQTQSDSFLLFSVREGKVKVLYWKCNENEFDILAKWLVNYCYANKVKILTIVDAKFAACVNQIRNPFVWSKNISMNIYATFDFNAQQLSVYDGDGDYVFT